MIIIPPLDVEAQALARQRQAILTKPSGALGELEALSIRLAGMTGRLDWLPTRKLVVVCAADHGVAAQGVSAYPQAVTYQMVLNFLEGGAAVNVLARQMDADMRVVDVGVIGEFEPHPALLRRKIAGGSADMTLGPALTPAQTEQAIALGIELSATEIAQGLDLLAVGEMGIGNTTAASAMIAAITSYPPQQVTGRGTGLDEAGWGHKVAMIERALAVNQPSPAEALQKVGGLEIACMTGIILGAASQRIPIVIDGLISTAAALAAAQIAPNVTDYLIAGHSGAEPGHRIALGFLGLTPLLQLGLRLGEGSGAVLAFPIIEAAMRTLNEMATFQSAGVSEREA